MNRAKWLCLDCQVDTGEIDEFYFVNTELWLSAVGSKSGMLCVGCLERRIDRTLTPDDFTVAYINNPRYWPKSERLRSRLGTAERYEKCDRVVRHSKRRRSA